MDENYARAHGRVLSVGIRRDSTLTASFAQHDGGMPMTEDAPAGSSWPFPVPFGWFSAGYADEFAPATAQARHLVGRLWCGGIPPVSRRSWTRTAPPRRAPAARAAASRTVIVLCFHAGFQRRRRDVDIPYAVPHQQEGARSCVPHRRAQRHGDVLVSPGCRREARMGDPQLLADLGGAFASHDQWTVGTAWQEIAENAVDGAHFQYVHGTAQPEVVFADFSGLVRHQKVAVRYNTKKGPFEGWQETKTYGPGFGITHFHWKSEYSSRLKIVDQFRYGGFSCFFQYVSAMGIDCIYAQEQFCSYLCTVQSGLDQLDNLEFPV